MIAKVTPLTENTAGFGNSKTFKYKNQIRTGVPSVPCLQYQLEEGVEDKCTHELYL